jgi:hypothetical protein
MQAPGSWAPPWAGLIDWRTSCPNGIGGHHRPSAVSSRDAGALGGCAPPNKGLRYPAEPPTVEEIILVMREAGSGPHADRIRGLIAIL